MGTVYILRSLINNRYYIGSTVNLERRLTEHNTGQSKYTRFTRPFELVFKQDFETLDQARRVEHKLKTYKNKKIIEQIISDKIIKGAASSAG